MDLVNSVHLDWRYKRKICTNRVLLIQDDPFDYLHAQLTLGSGVGTKFISIQ